MNRVFRSVIILASAILAMALVMPPKLSVRAQGFGTNWESSIQVLNLDQNVDANITITYYQSDGQVKTSKNDIVRKGESNTYFPLPPELGSFSGSVVVSADRPVVVVSNIVAKTAKPGLGSFVGFQQGAPKIYFPLVMKGNANNDTTFSVQNAGSTDADITIQFTPEAGSAYPSIPNITDTIKPGAAKIYDLTLLTQFSSVTKWVGSATVSVSDTANDAIVGVATTVNRRFPDAYQLYTYNAFTKGSDTVILPLIQENNNGNRTSVNCQNISSNNTTITVDYIPESTSYGNKPSESKSVPPNGVAVFLQNYQGTNKWVGSARVSSSNGSPLVCVVNQQKPSTGSASAYEGFDPASATKTVVLPLVQSRNGNATNGWVFSSINIATSNGQPQEVTCDFRPAPGFADPPSVTRNGASVVFLQNDVYGNGNKFVGGAVCTTNGPAGIFAIVNQTRQQPPALPRDILSSYNGFNQ